MIWKKCLRMCLVASVWMASVVVYAQNLIPNPGFETHLECPAHLGSFGINVPHWSSPTLGTTDYFHSCSQKVGAPENFNGAQTTFQGEGYAGFYAYAPGNYREYIQVRLNAPLKAGRRYILSYHVSLADRSDYAIRIFGVLFSSDSLSVSTKTNLSKKHWYAFPENKYNYLEMGVSGYMDDTSSWVRVEKEFQAEGTERYMVLGNFRDNRRTALQPTGKSYNKGAYYYIDQVELRPEGNEQLALETRGEYPLDSLQVFNSLLFEYDTYRLSGMGQGELDSLYQFLSTDSNLLLEVAGHTDGKGPDRYNQKLSERRCLAVVNYLEALGMAPGRIQWKGYGASRPVASNETEDGRSRNRRVEFRILREAPKIESLQN